MVSDPGAVWKHAESTSIEEHLCYWWLKSAFVLIPEATVRRILKSDFNFDYWKGKKHKGEPIQKSGGADEISQIHGHMP